MDGGLALGRVRGCVRVTLVANLGPAVICFGRNAWHVSIRRSMSGVEQIERRVFDHYLSRRLYAQVRVPGHVN